MHKVYNVFLLFLLPIVGTYAQQQTFEEHYQKFLTKYVIGDKVDYNNINQTEIQEIKHWVSNSDVNTLNDISDLAFLINVYNFLVIHQISQHYPITSVKDLPGFFENPFKVGSLQVSLNDIEKHLINASGNPYIHLLLNCGAQSCPPLIYINNNDDLTSIALKALDEKHIFQIDHAENEIKLSKIFYWYLNDFGSNAAIKKTIASYLKIDKLDTYSIEYQNYNWLINDISADDYLIYYPTKLYKKGGWELKVFNNYYTQSDNGFRSNFFSSFLQLQIGTNKNFNWGLDVKLRSVNQGDVGLFSALKFSDEKFTFKNDKLTFSRAGVSAIGPRIKYQPFKNKGHINFLHSIYFVPMSNTEGNFEYGYFDFQNLQIFNNVFIEKELSVKRRLFFDIGLHFENLNFNLPDDDNHTFQIQLPVTAIYSYYPTPKTTFYALANLALKPVFTYADGNYSDVNWDGYAQVGVGAKYYLTSYLELEMLYTYFADQTPGRFASTFNFGLRFFKF